MDNPTVVGTTDHGYRFCSNQMKEVKRMYVLRYSDFLEEWTFTTKENYERRIQNAMEIHYFTKRDGFACTADVIYHIMKQFGLSLDQITCVNCY